MVTVAMADAKSAPEAIEAFVRTLVAHHLDDLGRFRMLYLWIQFEPDIAVRQGDEHLLAPIHETTSASYDVLEEKSRSTNPSSAAAMRGVSPLRSIWPPSD